MVHVQTSNQPKPVAQVAQDSPEADRFRRISCLVDGRRSRRGRDCPEHLLTHHEPTFRGVRRAVLPRQGGRCTARGRSSACCCPYPAAAQRPGEVERWRDAPTVEGDGERERPPDKGHVEGRSGARDTRPPTSTFSAVTMRSALCMSQPSRFSIASYSRGRPRMPSCASQGQTAPGGQRTCGSGGDQGRPPASGLAKEAGARLAVAGAPRQLVA